MIAPFTRVDRDATGRIVRRTVLHPVPFGRPVPTAWNVSLLRWPKGAAR